MRNNAIAIIGFAVVLMVCLVVGLIFVFYKDNTAARPVACTAEAMQCPDGSYVGRTGPNCQFAACPAVVSTSTNWKSYSSGDFGFSLQYPPAWTKSNEILSVANPNIFFGNPLDGVLTYQLKIFVLSNPQNLSASDFVKQMLATDAEEDASNSLQGPAPQITPQFQKQYAVTEGSNQGYELYGVFAYDENDEEVYVQQNKQMLEFVFPVTDANSNIANPLANNATAHQILDTLKLDPNIWKFCGGIAGFSCATGYSCQLDGSYPDVGGHCVNDCVHETELTPNCAP